MTNQRYGIALRHPSPGNYYWFGIDANSKWVFLKCLSRKCTRVVNFTANPAIAGGLNTSNTLEVRAVGSHFTFFVNGTKVGQADDKTFVSGQVALAGDVGIECVFRNLVIFQAS